MKHNLLETILYKLSLIEIISSKDFLSMNQASLIISAKLKYNNYVSFFTFILLILQSLIIIKTITQKLSQMLLSNKLSQNHKKQSKIQQIIKKYQFQENNFDFNDLSTQIQPYHQSKNKIQEFTGKYGQKKHILASKNCNFDLNSKFKIHEQHMNIASPLNIEQIKEQDKKSLKLIIFDKFDVQQASGLGININNKIKCLNIKQKQSAKKTVQDLKKHQNDSQQTRSGSQTKQNLQDTKISSSNIFGSIFCSYNQKKENFIRVKKTNIQKDYKLKEIIGQGSYGIVYSSESIHTKQIRAIKVLKNKPKTDICKGNNIVDQQKILKKLDHPNILKLFQIYQNSNKMYIVSEICRGKSLSSYLKNGFSFTNQMKRQILHQIFKAVNYLNEQNIFHRDLKPDNIIFTQEITQKTSIQDIQVKIIDFGLSFQSQQKYIKDWSHIGTKNYMSPEAFQGVYSHKGDSWACGIIMHQMLLNSHPFLHIDFSKNESNKKAYKLKNKLQKWTKIQPSAQQLIQNLLQVNYILRSDIKTALSSSYFQAIELPVTKDTIKQKLLKYRQSNRFIDAVEGYISFTKVSIQKRNKYAKIFYFINKSHSGEISAQQLGQFLQISNPQRLTLIFQKINKSGKGLISFQELIVALQNKKQLLSLQNLQGLFQVLDVNKNNQIEKQELKYFIKTINNQELGRLYSEIQKVQHPITISGLKKYILSNANF